MGAHRRPGSGRRTQRCILGALVAVVDDIARLALADRHLQSRQYQLGPQMRLHCPTDDPTAKRIEYDSEIEEAGHRRDVGDVGDPKLVRAIGGKIPVH